MKLLFIDFDGCLHPNFPRRDRSDQENAMFSYLPRLEAVLRDHPDWKLVISSSWRESFPWDVVIGAFSPEIAKRILGPTPVIRAKAPPYPPFIRHEEILRFVASVRTAPDEAVQWLAIDDDPPIFPPDCPYLVLCDDGFRDDEERRLRLAMQDVDADTKEST